MQCGFSFLDVFLNTIINPSNFLRKEVRKLMGSIITGARERALFCQTLIPLIRGLEGREIIAELKNEIIIYGTLKVVDCFMNLTMDKVRMVKGNGDQIHFDFFFLQGKSLRYVRIPDDINMKKVLSDQLDIVTGKKARTLRKKAKEKRANWLRKKQAKNMGNELQAIAEGGNL